MKTLRKRLELLLMAASYAQAGDRRSAEDCLKNANIEKVSAIRSDRRPRQEAEGMEDRPRLQL